MTDQPHSYDNDPVYQAGLAEAFNSGLTAAYVIALKASEALAGTGGAADGEMPAIIPASALAGIIDQIMDAMKPVSDVAGGHAAA